jgi:replicative DNA helicase
MQRHEPQQREPRQQPEKVTPLKIEYSPPADPEAEQAVLGAILIRPELFDEIQALLLPNDFYRESHSRIFQAMLDIVEQGKPIDYRTVASLLDDRGQLEAVGGAVFLVSLSEEVGFATNAGAYAQRVLNKARLRRFLETTQQAAGSCFGPIEDIPAFLQQTAQDVLDAADPGDQAKGPVAIETAVAVESQVVRDNCLNNTGTGLSTGYLDLDNLIRWNPSDLIILAARPSMGKTALALNFLYRLARDGHRVGLITLETSNAKISRRLMSMIGQINGHRMNLGKLTSEEWDRFEGVRTAFKGLPFWVDDSNGVTVKDIRTRARRQHRQEGLDFLMIDYLQMIRPTKSNDSRENSVAEISRGLKALAKELNIPVLAISSLNRKFADRPNKRPQRSDLRESGAIEFDADLILLLYREEVDKPETTMQGVAEVNVDKNRDGPTGLAKLSYRKEYFLFENLADDRW